MKILNVDFSESVEWSYETMLPILKKANPNLTDKELKALIKASKLVKNGISKTTTESAERKEPSFPDYRNANNI